MQETPLDLDILMQQLIADDQLHCRWVNTLSMMENIGATKIVKSQHPLVVTENILKHAAEETRHAYFLKRQLNKLIKGACPTYAPEHLLNPRQSYQYINLLDTGISRLLKKRLNLKGKRLKQHAYVLVTYAIEVRADQIYTSYERNLKAQNSPVSVRGILIEEEQHLAEMESGIEQLFTEPEEWRNTVLGVENALFSSWATNLDLELEN